jgi:hypothetical protein
MTSKYDPDMLKVVRESLSHVTAMLNTIDVDYEESAKEFIDALRARGYLVSPAENMRNG